MFLNDTCYGVIRVLKHFQETSPSVLKKKELKQLSMSPKAVKNVQVIRYNIRYILVYSKMCVPLNCMYLRLIKLSIIFS